MKHVTLQAKKPRGWRLNEEARAGLVFASPFLIGFVIFTAGPLLASLYLSFTYYDVINPAVWTGLDNYRRMMEDERFTKTLYNTLVYVLLHVPTAIPFALGLALLPTSARSAVPAGSVNRPVVPPVSIAPKAATTTALATVVEMPVAVIEPTFPPIVAASAPFTDVSPNGLVPSTPA